MRIIPAIDLMGGECVRLSKGDFGTKKVYCKDPLDAARDFERVGVKYLHMVDLDGARKGEPCHLEVLSRVTRGTSLAVDYGGGVKKREDVEAILRAGATQISVGSLSVRTPALFSDFLKEFGGERFILAADVLDGRVMIDGWKTDSGYTVEELIGKFLPDGLSYVMVTDISRDGMLSGASVDLYRELVRKYPSVRFIASGGVASAEEIPALEKAGMDGAIIGKAYYEGRISLEQLGKL